MWVRIIGIGMFLGTVMGKLGFSIATIETNNTATPFSFPRSGAAIDMALYAIKTKYNNFAIKHKSVAVTKTHQAVAQLAELYYRREIEAIIGLGMYRKHTYIPYTYHSSNSCKLFAIINTRLIYVDFTG